MGAITIIITLHYLLHRTHSPMQQQKGMSEKTPRSKHVQINSGTHRPRTIELMTAVSFPSKDLYNITYGRSPDSKSTVLSDFPVTQCPMERRPSHSSEGCYRFTLYSLLIILIMNLYMKNLIA